MKRWNLIITITVVLYCIFLTSANIFLSLTDNREDKLYNVEINRLYQEISENGFENVSLEGYTYVSGLEYLSNNAPDKEKEEFYTSPNQSYFIKTVGNESGITGYIKFLYDVKQNQLVRKSRVILNGSFLIVGIFILTLLFYVRIQIIKPFHKISDMPYELSKGHLTQNLEENRNRFFGKFLWGLDLLRESLEEKKAKELKLEKEKKTLILSISHDIKTPLSTIKLYAKALYKNLYEDKEKQIGAARNIEKKAVEIEGFVSDIIKASQEDFLNIEVTNGEYYLTDLIGRLNNYYREKLKLYRTEFVIESYDNNLMYGDIERTMEVFENVIENAIKYGDGKNITISFSREDDCRLVTVSNTGCTLPEKELVHIFESFWRGSNVKDKKGSGLGLYICRQILHKMKGEIFADIYDDKMNVTVVLKMA